VLLAEVLRRWTALGKRTIRALVHAGIATWIVPTALLFRSPLWAAALPVLFAGVNLVGWSTGAFKAFTEEREQTLGIVFHPVALAAVILLFWEPGARSIAVASVLVMGWADPAAALVGRAVHSPSFRPFGEQKSVAGSTAMFLVAGAVVLGVALIAGEGLGPGTLVATAAVATVAELLSARGSDNLSVTGSVAATLWLLGWGG